MLKLFKELKPIHWFMVFLSLIFIVGQVWLDLKLPDYMSEITRLVQVPGSTVGQVLEQGGYMLLCTLGSVASAIIVGFFAARIAAALASRLRELLFSKVDSFSMEEINKFSTASLITRSTNDVTQIQMLVTMGLQVMIKAPIMAIWAITKIAGKGFEWSMATAIAVLIVSIFVTLINIFVMPKFKKMQLLIDDVNRVTRENLTGVRVIRAFNAEGFQEEKFRQVNENLTNTQLFTSRIMSSMMPLMNMILSGLSLSIYWIGAYLIDAALPMDRLLIFSNMVVFSSYAMQVIMGFMMMVMIFIMLPRASVSSRRIREVLDTEPTIIEGKELKGKGDLKGHIEFKNVSFKYPDASEYVLKDISFTAQKGETIAFIGSTGSGKSTLINLIPRFFDASQGQVLVDGVDVKDYKAEVLHSKIGYASQKAVLFRGTVNSNVAFGARAKNSTPSSIEKAVTIAQGKNFVESLPGGYEGSIAQGGTNLSGGQKQRLSIARAVCCKPEIYIFDDSFSALDYSTDRALRNALKEETAGVTNIIVAQRIGTIIDADKILVLDEGRIVGQGSHRELLLSCKIYREIAMSQLSEEELAI